MEELTIAKCQSRLTAGQLTARQLAEMYLARIHEVDSTGPALNSVIEFNERHADRVMPYFGQAAHCARGAPWTDRKENVRRYRLLTCKFLFAKHPLRIPLPEPVGRQQDTYGDLFDGGDDR